MSGQQIGTGVGFIAGFFLPGGPQVWAGIGGLIGGWISPTQIEGPKLTDGMGVTAQEGVPNPWGFGTFSCGVNVINAFDLQEHRDEDDGKGSGTEQVTYRYTRSFALGVCRANRNEDGTYSDIAGILRVTHNGKDIYNVLPDAPEEQRANNAKFLQQYRIYLGGEGQSPDPTLEAYLGAGNASSYRGQVYIVGTDIDQTEARGSMGTWEVVVAMGGTAGGHSYATIPSMPGYIMTSPDAAPGSWGGAIDTGLGAGITLLKATGGKVFAFDEDGNGRVSHNRGQTWESTSGVVPEDFTKFPRGMIYANGAWVVFQSAGQILFRSTDGVNFNAIDTGIARTWYCGAAGGGIMLIGGTLGRVLRSADGGLSWAEHIAAATAIEAMTWTRGVFMAVHADYTSTSAIGATDSWTARSFPGTLLGKRYIAPLGDRVVVTAAEDTWFSDDLGENWTQGGDFTSGISGSAPDNNIAHNGIRLFVGLDNSVIDSSLDGETWAESHDGSAAGTPLVAAEPGMFISPGATSLGNIVTEVCRRSGLEASDVDVSLLTHEVKGFKVAVETTGEAIISSLMPGYFFDAAEWDDKIRFVPRGGSPVFDLVVDDLAERDGPVIEETEVQEVELLRKVIVHTMDPDAGYVETPQSWERRAATVAATGEQTLRLPVVMDRDEARQVAHKRIKVAWSEPRRFALNLPYTRPELTPTDCGTITDRKGRQQRIRLEQMTEDSGIIEVREARLNRQSAYTSDVTGVQHGQRPTTTPQPAGPTFFWAGNLPSLRTADNTPGMYISAAGYQRGWHGAAIFLSTDNGASFQRIMEWPTASRMGVLTGDIDHNDEPIPVFMNAGTLATVTDDQLANRANGFAVTTGGVSEIGQFKTATLTGTQAYDLTNTLRGALGTAAASHVTGDPFVMLGSTVFLPIDISHAGRTLIFKAVSYGETLDDTAEYPVQFLPLFTSVVIEQYTDDAGNVYTDDQDNPYFYETTV